MMTLVATWLLALALCGPLAGVVLGLALVVGERPQSRTAARIVRAGQLLGLLAAIALVCVHRGLFGPGCETLSWTWGTWFHQSGPGALRADWTWRTDSIAASWLVLVGGVAWFALSRFDDAQTQPSQLALTLTAGWVHAAVVALVLSTNLVQMLLCWIAISVATLLMAGWTSSKPESTLAIRKAIHIGFVTDCFLLMAVLLIGQQVQEYSFDSVFSADGLMRLGAGNPAFPGLIGCLVALGVFGRVGQFPCFGWHRGASAWSGGQLTMIYAVGYVPSGIWLLSRCQPLLTSTEAPMALLGGLGALGAVLGAFVACGMDEPRRAIAFVVSSQVGVMLASLGSGASAAVSLCLWHQCGVSVAAFVLFQSLGRGGVTSQTRRIVIWCSVLSLAGVLPLSGGWSQRALLELHALPVLSYANSLNADSTGDADQRDAVSHRPVSTPHWGWLNGLWVAQGLAAFALVRVVTRTERSNQQVSTEVSRLTAAQSAGDVHDLVAGALLLSGGILAVLLKLPNAVPQASHVEWLVIGQCAAAIGMISAWRDARRSAGATPPIRWWDPMVRLSRECLYIDRLTEIAFYGPALFARGVSHFLESHIVQRLIPSMTIRLPAWLGMQTETLQVGRMEFYLATLLLSTGALLLTLFVVT